ncbi:MAG TPA: hypothetical protein VGR95_19600 [Thermoanaerobaculia bacterium]|nr:hypothetical protein [Thermoanaerobaculia bacterium]
MSHRRIRLALVIVYASAFAATSAFAQPHGSSQPGQSRSELKILGYHFDNFFQVTSPAPETNVNALASEYRFAYRPTASPTELFAHVNFIDYNSRGLSTSYGARAGVNHVGKNDDFKIFVDRQQHRPSFEVGNTFGQANQTMYDAEYDHHFGDWQIGGEGQRQEQRFPADARRNNNYNELGLRARYKGFGWQFTPEAGVYDGKRTVNLATETYRETGFYVQGAFIPTPNVYLSLQLFDRKRDYSNVVRTERRPGLSGVVDFKTSPRLSWLIYYSLERVRSSFPNDHFNDDLIIFGPEIRF